MIFKKNLSKVFWNAFQSGFSFTLILLIPHIMVKWPSWLFLGGLFSLIFVTILSFSLIQTQKEGQPIAYRLTAGDLSDALDSALNMRLRDLRKPSSFNNKIGMLLCVGGMILSIILLCSPKGNTFWILSTLVSGILMTVGMYMWVYEKKMKVKR